MTLTELQSLSDDELRVKVAKACEWQVYHVVWDEFTKTTTITYWYPPLPECDESEILETKGLPNYPASLDACAEFVTPFTRDRFEDALGELCEREFQAGRFPLRNPMHATARLRCIAFLLTKQNS